MALALSQLVLSLEQDEPYLYHDTTRGGFFSLLTELPGGAKRQTSHKLGDMPQVLANIPRVGNVWVSQNEFFKPNRRLVNVWRLPLQFIDLDTYNIPSLLHLGPDRLCGHVLQVCLDEGLPEPA